LTKETGLKGVYAAGDISRGASLVVWAIRDGLDAATAMQAQMRMISKETKAAE
jgi:glutamate synthase (NADPH/NADH) small chain